MTADDRHASPRRDLLSAVAAALVALGVYVATLAPGLVDVIDSPMFQFVGRVLGVPHNPGYPLYVLLTHPFSYLPIGSLAYRINLFSALMGALTVGLVFLVARRLGCRPLASAAAALGLAFGPVYWSQAVIAEVYTLDTALVTGVLLAALVWGTSGGHRTWLYFTAVALLATGLGNRTTILGLLPGLLAYAWLTRRAVVTHLRPLVVTGALLLAGLLPYGFILVRSTDPNAFLESRATTIGELAATIGGHQWWDRLFEAGWRDVIVQRIPWLVGHVLAPELTIAGLVFAGIGMARLARAHRAEALLLLSGALACVAFALNYSAVDLPVFFIPALLTCWVAMAVGAEWMIARARWPAARVTASLIVAAIPAWLWVQNYDRVDQSRNIGAAIVFDRLFDALPDRSALVREDFLVDRMVLYKILGDPPAGRGPFEAIGLDAAMDRATLGQGPAFAFAKSAQQLRLSGVDVGFEPLALLEGQLPAFLARLPDDHVVAIAVPASVGEAFVATGSSALTAVGLPGGLHATPDGALTAVGLTGARAVPVPVGSTDRGCVMYGARPPTGAASPPVPTGLTLVANSTEAAIRLGDRNLVSSTAGAAVAIWDEAGRLARTMVLRAADGFGVPVAAGPLAVYPIHGTNPGREIAPAWTSVPAVARTGSVLFRVGDSSTVVAYLTAAEPLAPREFDRSGSVGGVTTAEVPGAEVAAARAGHALGMAGADDVFFYRIQITGPGSVLVSLGGLPTDLIARVEGEGAAVLSALDTSSLLRATDSMTDRLGMARDDQAQLLGPGWSDAEADDVGPFRWIVGERASLLLPVRRRPRRIRLQAVVPPTAGGLDVEVFLDGQSLGARTMVGGWQVREWTIPLALAAPGTHVLTLALDDGAGGAPRDSASRRLAVSDVLILYDEGTAAGQSSDLPSCELARR